LTDRDQQPFAGSEVANKHPVVVPIAAVSSRRLRSAMPAVRACWTATVEKVLEAERGRRQVYTVVKGIPVRNYRAEVTLSPTGEGTRIH
jgi:hypothetical protein